MKDRDREDDRDRERDRGDREYERENGANGDDRKGMLDHLVDPSLKLTRISDREEPPPAHDDLDTAE